MNHSLNQEFAILRGINDLADKILKTVTSVLPDAKSSLLLFDHKKIVFDVKVFPVDKKIKVSEINSFLAFLEKENSIVEKEKLIFSDTEYREINFEANDYFDQTGATLSVPMVYCGKLVGILNIGAKSNLAQYSKGDISFLEEIKKEATIAIYNSLILERSVRQNIELQQSDRLKSEILANTSHELKNPINHIKGIVDLLISGIENKSINNEEIIADLKSLAEAGSELNSKVTDILEASKMAACKRRYNFSNFDLKSMVDISILYNQKNINLSNKPIKLHSEISTEIENIYGDSKAISKVIDNLLRNAIKFTNCGEIVLSAAILKPDELKKLHVKEVNLESRYIQISVRDTGIGINESDLELIFERFYRSDNALARDYSGTGLGLYICKQIIEDHNGKIWAESSIGLGSIFKFTIPIDNKNMVCVKEEDERRMLKGRRRAERRKSVSHTKLEPYVNFDEEYKNIPFGKGETILVVDDDPKNVFFVKKVLERHGYRVIPAYSGKEAIDKLTTNFQRTETSSLNRIELIITDLMMPDVTGYDLCRTLKNSLDFHYLPIIMLTIIDENKHNVYSCNLGADEYIPKPFEREVLLAKVGLLTKNSRSRRIVTSIMDFGKIVVSQQHSIKTLFNISLEEIERLVYARRISFMLVKKNGSESYLQVVSCKGIDDEDVKRKKIKMSEGISGYVWETKKPLLVTNISSDTRFKSFITDDRYQTPSFIISPMIYMNECLGVICVSERNETNFSIDELNYLTVLSDQLAVAINKMRDLKKIEEQNQIIMNQKNMEFMAETVDWVGHEVNTPAQAIMANVDMLIEKDPKNLDIEKYRKYLEYINESCYRIRNICEIIRSYGEVGIKSEIVNVSDATRNVINYAKAALFDDENRGMKIIFEELDDGEANIYGDVGMLELTLFNIVKNSYHSIRIRQQNDPKEGLIVISVFLEDESVVISLEDNGTGINKSDILNIFKRNFSTNSDGQGIGLFLAQKVVKDHGGEIEVESEVNEYSRFKICLPLLKTIFD